MEKKDYLGFEEMTPEQVNAVSYCLEPLYAQLRNVFNTTKDSRDIKWYLKELDGSIYLKSDSNIGFCIKSNGNFVVGVVSYDVISCSVDTEEIKNSLLESLHRLCSITYPISGIYFSIERHSKGYMKDSNLEKGSAYITLK